MKYLKSDIVRLGFFFGITLLILDYTALHDFFENKNWTFIHDIILFICFISLSLKGVQNLQVRKKTITFFQGYWQAFKVGLFGLGVYFFLGLFIDAFRTRFQENFGEVIQLLLPNLISESVFILILIFVFSFIAPIYFLLEAKTKRKRIPNK